MRQRTFSSGFEKHSKRTRKEKFLSEVENDLPSFTITHAVRITRQTRR